MDLNSVVKHAVKGNVEFQYFRDGNLFSKTEAGNLFYVLINDTNGATFNRTDKGIYFMRWIRASIEEFMRSNHD